MVLDLLFEGLADTGCFGLEFRSMLPVVLVAELATPGVALGFIFRFDLRSIGGPTFGSGLRVGRGLATGRLPLPLLPPAPGSRELEDEAGAVRGGCR